MWPKQSLKCIVNGHVSSTFFHRGTEYKHCVRCGEIKKTGRFLHENTPAPEGVICTTG